jgi:hypothetical protein
VAVGVPGEGPWKIEAWPDDGCVRCGINEADLAALRDFLRELTDQSRANQPNLPVSVVRTGAGGGETFSMEKLREAVAACDVGSAGMLSPNSTIQLVAYGVRFDCPRLKRSMFMSVVFGNEHTPATIYWLPDGPIIVADAH